ncbi:MAG: type II secretion system protein [Dehalococcoidaceae bacterium]|nr:type II secretion system protein [Dehalococcoidaceae bacterium]
MIISKKHQDNVQGGFTLIELIIAITITSLILGAAATGVYQLIAGNAANSNYMTAVRQVQQVGHWVSRDMIMANVIDTSNSDDPDLVEPGDSMNVLRVYWFDIQGWDPTLERTYFKHKIVYNLTSEGLLYRHHFETGEIVEPIAEAGNLEIDGTETWTLVDTMLVAVYIEQDAFAIYSSGSGQYEMDVTAHVTGFQPALETRTYDIKRRPE